MAARFHASPGSERRPANVLRVAAVPCPLLFPALTGRSGHGLARISPTRAPDRSTSGLRRAHPLVRALVALAATATLAAACSGAPQATDPTAPADAAVSGGATPSSDDAASAPVEADDQAGGGDATGIEDDRSAGDGAGVGDPAADPAADPAGDTPPAGESGSAESGPAENGSTEDAVPDEGAPGDGSGEGAEPEGGFAEDVTPEDSLADGASPAPYLEFNPWAAGPIAPLTGSITTDFRLGQRRPLAVKIGNGDSKDRPQAGLAAADIVYEVLVEAGFTRLLAVFHSEIPARIGPVRSARSSDFAILEDLAAPYLATSGANSTVLREMRAAARAGTLIDVGAMRMGAPYSRDRSRPAPHNLYFSYESLGGGDPESLPGGPLDTPPEVLFEYGSPNPPGLPGAAGVTVAYTTLFGGEVSHVWDDHLGGWVRIQDGTLHTTETAVGVGEIAPANVVVLSMPYSTSAADRRSPQALSYGSGDALVLTSGSVHEASWERTEDRIGFRFQDTAGNPLSLSSGSTWLLLGNTSRRWPLAEVTVLTSSDATRLLADARAAAEAEANAAAGS